MSWGPLTQVHHQNTRYHPEALWPSTELHLHSVSVMFRTALFPAGRGRLRGTTPNPPEFFRCIAEAFREALAELPWRMPSLEECLALQEATPVGEAMTT